MLFTSLLLAYLLVRHLTASPDWIVADPGLGPPVLMPGLRLVLDVVMLLLVILSRRNRPADSQRIWLLFVGALVLVLVVSAVAGSFSDQAVDATLLASAFRGRLVWLLPFVIGLRAMNLDDAVAMKNATIIVGIAQVPLAFAQYYRVGSGDDVTGLMGENGSGVLAIYQLVCVCLVLAPALGRSFRSVIPRIAVAGVMLVPPILAEALAAFYLVPLAVVLMVTAGRTADLKIRNVLLVVGAVVALTGAMGAYYTMVIRPGLEPGGSSFYFFRWDRLRALVLHDDTRDHVTRYEFLVAATAKTLEDDRPLRTLLGFGTGFTTSSRLSPRNISDQILRDSTGAGSFLTEALLENGVLGVLAVFGFLASIVFAIAHAKKRAAASSPARAYLGALLTAFLLVAATSLYNRGPAAPAIALPIFTQVGAVLGSIPLFRIRRQLQRTA